MPQSSDIKVADFGKARRMTMTPKRARKRRTSAPGDYDGDLIDAFRHFTRGEAYTVVSSNESDECMLRPAAEGEQVPKYYLIPAWMRDDILATLQRATKTGAGRRSKSTQGKDNDSWTVTRGEIIYRRMVKEGKPRGKATAFKAAEEAKARTGSKLAVITVKRRMRYGRAR